MDGVGRAAQSNRSGVWRIVAACELTPKTMTERSKTEYNSAEPFEYIIALIHEQKSVSAGPLDPTY